MVETIVRRYGSAERIWVMDPGILTEEVLAELRVGGTKIRYLIGTPKGRLTRLEAELAEQPWTEVNAQLRVKLVPASGEFYVLAESRARQL